MADPITTASAGTMPRTLEALAGHYAAGPGVSLVPLAARAHVSLRAHPDAVSAVGGALGLSLPGKPKTSVVAEGVSALWLGPEDWLLVGGTPASQMIAAIEGSGTVLHSAVDVTDRYVGIRIEGPAAEAVLSSSCPQDLRLQSFPVGAVSRSVFAKADMVIWRRGESEFELFCVRSFADYVWGLLTEAAQFPAV
ncbi:sarcosine oxidase subunit gamma [Aureimonas sp. SA4125]|uniref:sarcosine oxidase subunit gamma n=1 Tax=Aureimonas sp. SA4125 TaxID=2826993 RepID=UPI001CC56A03|nr:sarcosine oxidase subunit gamma family protein [Aureimonas sp. SA4125]BDA86036.1 sarcosine oxidase subunit gamma [Aureimonas sp. SA4125]